MKRTTIYFLSILIFSTQAFSQNNTGIGVAAPTEALSVARGLNIDHDNQNAGSSLTNGLKFGNSVIASQQVGISSNRVGATEPFSLDFYTSNTRRVIVTQDGFVGINTIPTSFFLEVGGTVKGNTVRSAGSIFAEGGSVVAENAVNAGTSITAGTNITAANNITATGGDIISTNGELRADGRGVVMSNSSSRQKVVAYTATLGVTNLAAGSSVTGNISIAGGTFSATPTAYVGNVITENGDYYRAMLVLENVTTTSITVRVVNVTSSPISFTGAQWRILAIGSF